MSLVLIRKYEQQFEIHPGKRGERSERKAEDRGARLKTQQRRSRSSGTIPGELPSTALQGPACGGEAARCVMLCDSPAHPPYDSSNDGWACVSVCKCG